VGVRVGVGVLVGVADGPGVGDGPWVGVGVTVGVGVRVGVGVAQIQVVTLVGQEGFTHTLSRHCNVVPALVQSLVALQLPPQLCTGMVNVPKQPFKVTGAAIGRLAGTLGATGTVASCLNLMAVITAITPKITATAVAASSKMVRFLFAVHQFTPAVCHPVHVAAS
jgi:hypothetical protein